MKKLSLILASVVALSTVSVGIGAAVSASASPAHHHRGLPVLPADHVKSNGVIEENQIWTLYDTDWFFGDPDSYACEELTFGHNAKTWTGTHNDSGTAKGNTTLTFAASNIGLWSEGAPLQFVGKYNSGDGFFLGAIEETGGYVVGSAILALGSDPFVTGGC